MYVSISFEEERRYVSSTDNETTVWNVGYMSPHLCLYRSSLLEDGMNLYLFSSHATTKRFIQTTPKATTLLIHEHLTTYLQGILAFQNFPQIIFVLS